MKFTREQAVAAFWQKVKKGRDCWEWQAGTSHFGYGWAWGLDERYAHRQSWRLAHGDIPKGICVLHKCDNPLCVRPDHLFLGTRLDNMRDCIQKGRFTYAQHRKLTNAQILKIRKRWAAGETQAAIAKDYPVNVGHISKVCRGLTSLADLH